MAPIRQRDLFLTSARIFLVLMQMPVVYIVQPSVLSVSISFPVLNSYIIAYLL